MPRRPTCIAITLLATAAACGPLRRSNEPPALVVFENQSTEQADVFVVRSAGDRTRIGTVFSTRTDTLRVPATYLSGDGSVNIVARILASARTPSTGSITLRSGERIMVSLPPQANTLTVLPAAP